MRTLSARRFGACAAACGVLWLSGCKDPVLEPVEYPPGPGEPGSITLTVNHDVDILFVIDNSGSMAEEQNKLATDFGALVEVLERPEVAANYRIGITTTDDGNPWCDTTPEQGALQLASCRSRPEEFVFEGATPDPPQEVCVSTCPAEWTEIETLPSAAAGDDGGLAPRSWLESTEGRTNLPDGLSITQAFGCVGPQGIRGCGFESPLEAMWKALRRWQTDGDPDQGFLRANAVLSIVHLTDEEDCSYNPDFESIFLPEGNRLFWSDPAAEAPTSAVCWNAGVLCEGSSPYEGCGSVNLDDEGNEVSNGEADDLAVIRPVARYIDELQEIETNKQTITPDQEVLVSIIAGVGPDGEVTYQDAMDDPQVQQDFGIGLGCQSGDGTAVPPVRLRELAQRFQVGDQPNMFSVCDDDYSPALTAIGEAIAEQIKPACMPACVADTVPSTPDVLDPSCRVLQQSPRDDGSFEEIDLFPCEADGTVPEGADGCFVYLTGDERSAFCSDTGFNLELMFVRREGVPLPGGTAIHAACNTSPDREVDCPDLP